MKLTKKTSSSHSYKWRPNFRNYEALPDIRAVRTQFFVPALAICVASVFAIFILFQEFRAMNLNEDIGKLEEEIKSYDARHDEKVALNSDFMAIVKTMDEVVEFKRNSLIGSDFLLTVSSNLIEGMYLNRVEYLPGRASIDGSVEVPAERASRLVNDYLKAIEEADALQGLLTEYKLTTLARDASGKNISFRIEITKKEAGGSK